MTPENLIHCLKNGQPVFGTLITSPSPFWPDKIKKIGLDFVFIDTEHIPLEREQLSWMCQTYRALDMPALVRIPSPRPYEASVALDGGAAGIIAPYIESAEQVRELIGAVKLRPLKGKKLDQLTSGKASMKPELETYLRKNSGDNLLIVNIESVPAMEALEDILSLEMLDAVLIGPHDLSCSLGIPEQYDHPEFIEAADRIIEKARSAGKGAGVHAIYPRDRNEAESRWIKKGANLVLHSSDIIATIETLSREIAEVKVASGIEGQSAKTSNINI